MLNTVDTALLGSISIQGSAANNQKKKRSNSYKKTDVSSYIGKSLINSEIVVGHKIMRYTELTIFLCESG